MCMEDFEIGRRSPREEKYSPVSAVASQALNPDPSRVSCIIGNIGPNTAYLGFTNQVTPTAGMPIPVGLSLVQLDVTTDGRILCDGFWAVCAGGQTAVLAFWSAYLEEGKR